MFQYLRNIHSHISQNNTFQDVPIFCLYCLKHFWYNKINTYGVLRIQKARNHELLRFTFLDLIKSGLYQTKLEQNNSPELLSLLFPYIYNKIAHKWPTIF